ncbi:ferritin-like domain-containing protein [Gordonia phthalatica]|uniref:Membrane protein n=1 Tax=Gordonia phthalatica TaxID=1136941 RepID=A0A0N9N9J1_9ACTN|nr:ferritin-like domain-containing protein [Gordonia phthalatica]ALG84078.1 membrane protein [Gordonia phthalatica]
MTWTELFSDRARHRAEVGDPDWHRGSTLPPSIVASLQRFQVGESGDGARLIGLADAAGDPEYAQAVRMFVAEENNHARLLAELLSAAGETTLAGHWSDQVFVWCRRALGLRCELLVLSVAELIALEYYGALATSPDHLLHEVSARILDDEVHHVRFQEERSAAGFADTPPRLRGMAGAVWLAFAAVVAVVVALDHGGALRAVGRSRGRFIRSCVHLMSDFRTGVFAGRREVALTK